MSKLLCRLGFHKWRPYKGAVVRIDYRSKYDCYEVTDGHCVRCEATGEIRRDYYW